MGGSKRGTAALTATFPSLPGMAGRDLHKEVPTASAGKPPSAPSAQAAGPWPRPQPVPVQEMSQGGLV